VPVIVVLHIYISITMSCLVGNEDEHQAKRQKVAAADDSGEDIGGSSEDGSDDSCDDGDGNKEGEEDDEPFRGNEMIDLVFMEPDSALDYFVSEPQYTHQVFDEEEHLEEVRFMEQPEDCRVTVNVRCGDYRHLVGVPAGNSAEEQQQLLKCLQKALPADAEIHLLHGNNNNEEEEGEDAAYLDRVDRFAAEAVDIAPPGKLVHSFTLPSSSNSKSACASAGAEETDTETYEIYLASNKDAGASLLVRRAEALAMWFIETADSVDFAGDDRWHAVFLYRRTTSAVTNARGSVVPGPSGGHSLSLAGYYTLFTFHNPFAGSKVRVCQALVLPHLQGSGLGKHLLLSTYEHVVHRQGSGLVELTVEDPAPGFQAMRDACDVEWCLKQTGSVDVDPDTSTSTSNTTNTFLGELSSRLRITAAQTEYLSELTRFARLKQREGEGESGESDSTSSGSAGAGVVPAAAVETDWKAFRLSIKRRLLREHPDLRSLEKPKMQQELETLYGEQQERFERGNKARQRLLAKARAASASK